MSSSVRITLTTPTQTFSYTSTEPQFKIGRSLNCDFNIPKEDLSREHCLFTIENGDYYITDLGSKNGICVDRVRIPVNTKTRITSESYVVLSNIYVLKINAFEIKTKADMIIKKAEPDIETLTFQLDLPDEDKKERFKRPARRPARPRLNSEIEAQAASSNYEYVKMIGAFILVLAVLVYQALGE